MAANHVSRWKHEEQLDDLLRKDAEYKFTYGHSGEDHIERLPSAVHPDYPDVFSTAALEWYICG